MCCNCKLEASREKTLLTSTEILGRLLAEQFSRILIVELPDLAANFIAGCFLIFMGKKCPGNFLLQESPAESFKIDATKSLTRIAADWQGQEIVLQVATATRGSARGFHFRCGCFLGVGALLSSIVRWIVGLERICRAETSASDFFHVRCCCQWQPCTSILCCTCL